MADEEITVSERKFAELILSRTIIEVYRDRLADEPFVGRLIRSSRQTFLMEKCDDLYRSDGMVVAHLSDITRIRSGSRELANGTLVEECNRIPREIPDFALLAITTAITRFQLEFGHVNLHLERCRPKERVIGQMIDYDDDFLVLRQFGTFRTGDCCELLVRTEEITCVEADGNYERRLMALYEPGGQQERGSSKSTGGAASDLK